MGLDANRRWNLTMRTDDANLTMLAVHICFIPTPSPPLYGPASVMTPRLWRAATYATMSCPPSSRTCSTQNVAAFAPPMTYGTQVRHLSADRTCTPTVPRVQEAWMAARAPASKKKLQRRKDRPGTGEGTRPASPPGQAQGAQGRVNACVRKHSRHLQNHKPQQPPATPYLPRPPLLPRGSHAAGSWPWAQPRSPTWRRKAACPPQRARR